MCLKPVALNISLLSGREKEVAVDLYRIKLKPPIYYFFKIDLLGHLIIGVA